MNRNSGRVKNPPHRFCDLFSLVQYPLCRVGISSTPTIRMIGGFESSADNNTKQPVKGNTSKKACDLTTAKPFLLFDFYLVFMLNQLLR